MYRIFPNFSADTPTFCSEEDNLALDSSSHGDFDQADLRANTGGLEITREICQLCFAFNQFTIPWMSVMWYSKIISDGNKGNFRSVFEDGRQDLEADCRINGD
jgi:hypothetical protein